MCNFSVLNRGGDVVAGFDNRADADEFVENNKAFGLSVEFDSDKFDELSKFLDSVAQWVEEYCTENEDFASGYDCIVFEDAIRWRDRFEDYVRTNFDLPDDVSARDVWERLDKRFDFEWVYCSNEYAAYSGEGFCAVSFDIGEQEEQIEVDGHDILRELHECDALDDYLDEYNGDLYISRCRPRVYDEDKGHYVFKGRETYKRSAGYYYLYGYVNCPGQWHAVISDDCIADTITYCSED